MKITRVQYQCIGCGKDCSTTNHNLRYRKHHQNEPFCSKCLIKLEKSAAVFAAVPAEYHYQIYMGIMDYEIAAKYLIGICTRLMVRFVCRECSTACVIKWYKLMDRKYQPGIDVCYSCLQRSINTSPIALAEHRERTCRLWDSPEFRKTHLKAFETHNNRMQIDVEYAAKHRRKSKSISGIIEINDRKIRFDSAYELIYINHVIDSCIIRRCEFAIAYERHFYHPDFFLIYPDGKRSIIEIKGFYRNRVDEKQIAANEYIAETGMADDYKLYDTDRLLDEGILTGLGGARMWKQIRGICNERSVIFSDPKHRKIAEIGRRRYYKEIKN